MYDLTGWTAWVSAKKVPCDILPDMSDIHPTNQALLTILENQMDRTKFAFEGLTAETYSAEPGGDCNSLERIGDAAEESRDHGFVCYWEGM